MIFASRARSLFCCTALLLVIPSIARAQTDVIRGRVTNTDDMALPSVRVTATSIPGNVTREVRTDARGNFQIVFPNGTGDYMVGYALIGYVYRQQQVKRLAIGEDEVAGPAAEQRRPQRRTAILVGRIFEGLPGEIEAIMLGIAVFQPRYDAHGLDIVIETAIGRHADMERSFAGMPEGRVTQIVAEGDRLG